MLSKGNTFPQFLVPHKWRGSVWHWVTIHRECLSYHNAINPRLVVPHKFVSKLICSPLFKCCWIHLLYRLNGALSLKLRIGSCFLNDPMQVTFFRKSVCYLILAWTNFCISFDRCIIRFSVSAIRQHPKPGSITVIKNRYRQGSGWRVPSLKYISLSGHQG